MIEDMAALGVVALSLLVFLTVVALMRITVIKDKLLEFIRVSAPSKLVVLSILALVGFLGLVYGVASVGLVNSLPAEQHVERNRENNRVSVREDKDGCLDMRTLGRSNGVYMAVNKCKSGLSKELGEQKDKDRNK